jgi:hypothetical protein
VIVVGMMKGDRKRLRERYSSIPQGGDSDVDDDQYRVLEPQGDSVIGAVQYVVDPDAGSAEQDNDVNENLDHDNESSDKEEALEIEIESGVLEPALTNNSIVFGQSSESTVLTQTSSPCELRAVPKPPKQH